MKTDMTETCTQDTTYTYDRSQGTTSELVIISTPSSAQKVLLGVLLFMCFFAFIANLAMLISLLAYKQTAKKTINVFVCNQTVLDLVVSFFSAVKVTLRISGYLNTPKTGVLRTCTTKLEVKIMIIDGAFLVQCQFLSNIEK